MCGRMISDTPTRSTSLARAALGSRSISLGHAHLGTTDTYLGPPRLDDVVAAVKGATHRVRTNLPGVAQMAHTTVRRRPESNRCRRLCSPADQVTLGFVEPFQSAQLRSVTVESSQFGTISGTFSLLNAAVSFAASSSADT